MRDSLYQPFPMLAGRRGQIWRYAPEYRRPRHFHNEPELNLVIRGTGSFGTGGSTIQVSAGDLLCWAPGRDHELLGASADLDLFVVAVTPELSASVLEDRNVMAMAGPVRVRLPRAALSGLNKLCSAPLATREPSGSENHVAEFWLRAHGLRFATLHGAGLAERGLRSLFDRPELGRGDRARLVRGYPSELSRHFHRDVGLTLSAYRTRLRLLRFIQLADAGSRTLLAAALEAGFGSYSQCHRAFQNTIGCTPRAFFWTDVRHEMQEAFSPW
jgi:AraC-like DNA-binding protein